MSIALNSPERARDLPVGPIVEVTWRDILLRWPDLLSVVLDHGGEIVLWAGTGQWSRFEVSRAVERARPSEGWRALASDPPRRPQKPPVPFFPTTIDEEPVPYIFAPPPT